MLFRSEPFGSVDPLNRERLQDIFVNLQKELKKTVLFVTHDVEEAIMIGDRICVMNEGKIEGFGTPGHFAAQNSGSFISSFLGSEYPLKLLKRYTIKDLDLPLLSESLGSKTDVPVIRGEDLDLKQLLSEMMRLGSQRLIVILSGEKAAQVSYSDIVSYLKEVSGK